MKAKRFTDPNIRNEWKKLQPTTITAAVDDLHSTVPIVKHRRQFSEPGQFPNHIPVSGYYNTTSSLYDLRLLKLWANNAFDVRNAPEETDELNELIVQVSQVAKPSTLMGIAEQLLPLVLLELSKREINLAVKKATAYREDWASGSKPLTPKHLALAGRRVRSWRETWSNSNFPEPLPVKAVGAKSTEMFYSIVEVEKWLKERHRTYIAGRRS